MANVTKRNTYKKAIEKQLLFVTTTSEFAEATLEELEVRLESLTTHWAKFEESHLAVLATVAEENCEVQDGIFDVVQDAFFKTASKIKKSMKDLQAPTTTTAQSGSIQVEVNTANLGPIQIDPFNGDYADWRRFHDTFKALIHDKATIPDVVKFTRLVSFLGPNVKAYISGYQQTAENYQEAWRALQERYDNKARIVDAHLTRLMSLPYARHNNSQSLKNLIDRTNEIVRQLAVLQVRVDHWDVLIVHLLMSRIDSDIRRDWELSRAEKPNDEMPSLVEVVQFLERKASSMEFMHQKQSEQQSSSTKGGIAAGSSQLNDGRKAKPCFLCNEQHHLHRCSQFHKMLIHDRWKTVRAGKLCANCFREDHSNSNYPHPKCRTCGREKHNSWLCSELEARKQAIRSNNLGVVTNQQSTLLATACALAEAHDKRLINVRALCDTGSQINLVTVDCIKRLGIQMKKGKFYIQLAGGEKSAQLLGEVYIKLMPTFQSSFAVTIRAGVLGKISSILPTTLLSNEWPGIRSLQLADKEFHIPRHVDILLGAGAWAKIVQSEIVAGNSGNPTAQNTKLGYVIFGEVNTDKQRPICNVITDKNNRLEALLKKFWEINEPNAAEILSPEEKICEDIFKATTTRDSQGRYIVRLPLKSNVSDLGNSLPMAIKRFTSLESRFFKNKAFQIQFRQFIDEYEELGHLKAVHPLKSDKAESNIKYYIPTQAVENPKFRVVFDASAKTTQGLSLNDVSYVGPKIQDNLLDIMVRFRYHKVAITADIIKMFRQVQVHENDQPLQRILWRKTNSDDIYVMQLTTVTYGTSSAPFLAVRALRQCILDYAQQYPKAAQAALRDLYVDDLLTGANSVEEAIELFTDTTEMLLKGGFPLDKWTTSSPEVAKQIKATNVPVRPIERSDTTGILGIQWNPHKDFFCWKIELEIAKKITKREITSRVGRLFDPIGYLQPVIVTAKCIIQELWKSGSNWDEEVSEAVKTMWATFENDIRTLQRLKVPRWLGSEPTSALRLHAFCDASSKAYAAVIYIETTSVSGHKSIHMVAAKSRVAPIKTASIPRLELCAAVLLADLQSEIIRIFQTLHPLQDVQKFCWTDSTVVLYWLNKLPCQFKTFVANRVAKVQEATNGAVWRHVPTADNPADAASRGISANDLINNRLWWEGPEWLPCESNWPSLSSHLTGIQEEQAIIEQKAEVMINLVTQPIPLLPDSTGECILQRFSSLHRAQRVVALVLRFINCIKTKREDMVRDKLKEKLGLSSFSSFIPTSKEELNNALILMLHHEQNNMFKADRQALLACKGLPEKSSLVQLKPFIGDGDLIRMGSRVEAREAEYDTRYPIVVPNNGRLVKLLVDDAHKRTLHGGVQIIMQYLRYRFWITRMRQIVRTIVRRCVICSRHQAVACQQQMASLPKFRVQRAPPFSHTGVDYAGPVRLKAYEGARKIITKGYMAIFVCMVTKAVHIEVVSNQSSEAFLAAFSRFHARRGNCTHLYSDNATTFVGAANELDNILESWQAEATTQALSTHGVVWTFITPQAPHQGGMWEAAVKSAKHHLHRVTNGHLMTFEQLTTVTSQIESCLNSRPMFALSDDPADSRAITPADLLGAGSAITPLVSRHSIEGASPSRRWQFLQWLVADFWQKWHTEYLATLQRINKWCKASRNIAEGDLVLVIDQNSPPARWAMGRVIKTYPGKDGLVRNVTLKTAVGELTRAIQKLVRLPVNEE